MIPGFGAISGGAGGIAPKFGDAKSGASGGEAGGSGGQVFNFAPPLSVQTPVAVAQSLQMPLLIAGAVAVVWLFKRR
jgi:hypothetical protein